MSNISSTNTSAPAYSYAKVTDLKPKPPQTERPKADLSRPLRDQQGLAAYLPPSMRKPQVAQPQPPTPSK